MTIGGLKAGSRHTYVVKAVTANGAGERNEIVFDRFRRRDFRDSDRPAGHRRGYAAARIQRIGPEGRQRVVVGEHRKRARH